jgi:DNA-binding winged helix-turn-helix (wHTH) protein/Tfp pilus assembly protein PilF
MEVTEYRFKTFLLDVEERQLFNDQARIRLTPKAFDLLAYLVRNAGHLVHKDELLQMIWPDAFVEEGNLTRTIHTLRKALEEDDNGNKFIETVPTVGYRFVAKIDYPTASFSQTNAEERDLGTDALTADSVIVNSVTQIPDHREHADSPKSQNLKLPIPEAGKAGLAGAAGFILIALVTGFWVTNRSSNSITSVRASSRQSNHGEAYNHFKQGRLLIERRRRNDFKDALASFEKAIRLDPSYAAAHAGIADAKMGMFWGSNSHDDIVQARSAIEKAIGLDESNSYAHTVSCRLRATYDWDFKAAEKECQRAVALDPADHEAQRELAYLLNALGRMDEAVKAADRAIALAPTSFNKRARAQMLYYSRRYDEAIAQLVQIEETDPEFYSSIPWLRRSYEMKGDHSRALEHYIRQIENAQKSADPLVSKATSENAAELRSAFAASGWQAVLRLMEPSAANVDKAAVYAQLGETERAFETLNRSIERHDIMMVTIGSEPRLDPIRNDLRFGALLRRIGVR